MQYYQAASTSCYSSRAWSTDHWFLSFCGSCTGLKRNQILFSVQAFHRSLNRCLQVSLLFWTERQPHPSIMNRFEKITDVFPVQQLNQNVNKKNKEAKGRLSSM